MLSLRSKKCKKGFHIYIDYYYKGSRAFEFLGLYTTKNYTCKNPPQIRNVKDREVMMAAEKLLIQRQYEFSKGGYQVPEKGSFHTPKKEAPSVLRLLEKYIESKSKPYDLYKNTLGALRDYHKSDTDALLVDKDWLNDFQQHLLKTKNPTTTANYMGVLRSAFLSEKDKPNPFSNFSIVKKSVTEKNELHEHEVKKLFEIMRNENSGLSATDRDLLGAFLFCCYTGLRHSDVSLIKSSDIYKSGEKHYIRIKTKKRNKELTLPLHETALSLIDLSGDTLIFPRLPRVNCISRKLTAIVEMAGIEKRVSFHCSRVTFSAMCIEAGIDIYTLSKMLTHSDITTTTSAYARLSASRLVAGIDSLPTF